MMSIAQLQIIISNIKIETTHIKRICIKRTHIGLHLSHSMIGSAAL
jgi:hypothetical protein